MDSTSFSKISITPGELTAGLSNMILWLETTDWGKRSPSAVLKGTRALRPRRHIANKLPGI